MADAKPEVVITSVWNEIGQKFQRLYICFGGRRIKCIIMQPCETYNMDFRFTGKAYNDVNSTVKKLDPDNMEEAA